MRFHDRVAELVKLVREKREVLVSELSSLLGVSPNYARELKKEALKSGELVEDQVSYLTKRGSVDVTSTKRYLFDFEYHAKLLRKQKKETRTIDASQNTETACCNYCFEEKMEQGMDESKAREASRHPTSELNGSEEGYICNDHFRSRPRIIGG